MAAQARKNQHDIIRQYLNQKQLGEQSDLEICYSNFDKLVNDIDYDSIYYAS